jgi:putative holliday junction resolvase
MPRIIGIDYGSKRVGLSVTDPEQIIATALATVASHEVMKYLENYVGKEKVEAFVVGEVEAEENNRGNTAALIADFVKGLKKRFPDILIYMEDESFSSQRAFQTMLDSGISQKKRREKGLVDRISAVLILQSFLEKRAQNK